jgi:hypothetical protein
MDQGLLASRDLELLGREGGKMRFSNRVLALTFGMIGCSLIGRSALAGSVNVYVGYAGPTTDQPTVNGDPVDVGTPGDGTSGAAIERQDFLNALGGMFYYDDFQEASTYTYQSGKKTIGYADKSFNDIGISSYSTSSADPMVFQASQATMDFPAPGASITPADPSSLFFRDAPIGTNTRGNFGAFDPTLVAPIPGGPTPAQNWYLDIDSSKSTSVTFDFDPGQYAVGLELNDLIQPSDKVVTVDFSDGTSEVFGADKKNGNPDGTLTTNNTWFLGVTDSTAYITSLTINTGGDPITLDNLYVAGEPFGGVGASSVPLPTSAAGALGLLGIVGAMGCRRSRKRNPRVLA